MTFWKIRHIPTGLFYKPSKYRSKANLSKKGKVYQSKPTLRYIGDTYHFPLPEAKWPNADYENRRFIESEWEIVAYEVG